MKIKALHLMTRLATINWMEMKMKSLHWVAK